MEAPTFPAASRGWAVTDVIASRVWPTLQLTLDHVTPPVEAALGDAAYASAFDRGAHAAIDEMTALATR